MRVLALPAVLAALLSLPTASVDAQTMRLQRIVNGLNQPVFATAPEGDERIFIVAKRGVVKMLVGGAILPVNFLSIATQVSNTGEQGLLGMAFHPNYANNGWVYFNYTNNGGSTVISRFTLSATNPNRLDHSSEEILLTIAQPYSNHNGGWIGFGPDGYLYIATGDGGSANDPGCRAQNKLNLLGKMLRIDVDSGLPYAIPVDNPFVGDPDYAPEIYHLGLRNPWRNSFDRLTGDLFIGDVGQDAREEISFSAAGVDGLNFGWKAEEGNRCNSTSGCGGLVQSCGHSSYREPIYELLQGGFGGPGSITGGYVYRGCAIPSMQGTYFFADYIDDKIRSFDYDVMTKTVNNFTDRTAELTPAVGTLINIASFAEDGFGEILIIETTGNGEIYKIVPVNAGTAGANTFRNGAGTNSTCYAGRSLPIMGNFWSATIDTTMHPNATLAGIVAYTAPSSGTILSGGEALIDLASSKLFQVIVPATSAEPAVISGPIPCDPAIDGLITYTQAFILGGPWELCNALDLRLGWY